MIPLVMRRVILDFKVDLQEIKVDIPMEDQDRTILATDQVIGRAWEGWEVSSHSPFPLVTPVVVAEVHLVSV